MVFHDSDMVGMTMADSEEYLLTYNGKELKLVMGAEGMEMIFEKNS